MTQSGSQNSARNGVIEDDVTADREAAQPVRLFRDNEVGRTAKGLDASQLLPLSPQAALRCQQLDLLIEQVNERIGLIVAVIGDE